MRVPDGQVDLARFPDFLIVGPQRTGTTWIHESLRDHPDVSWPRLKEIFFFSRLKSPNDPKFQSADLEWYLRQFRDPLWFRAVKMALSLRASGAPYRPRVIGEATASYAAMDGDLIDEIVTLNPDIRAIMMVRDPVERAWSHAKKDLVRNRGRKFEDVGEAEFVAFFRDPYQRRCAQYVLNADRWTQRLSAGHFFVGRFDDVSARPAELLRDICAFLGIRSERRFLGRVVDQPVNPTAPEPVPPRYRAMLEELLADDIDAVKARFGWTWPVPSS